MQADARLLLQLDAVMVAPRGGAGRIVSARHVLRGGGTGSRWGNTKLVRLIERLFLRRNLLLNAATTGTLRQAEVKLRKRHPVQILVLLRILLVAFDHRHIGTFRPTIASQVHLAIHITVDTSIDLNLLAAIYRNLITSIFLFFCLHERQTALVRCLFVDIRSRRAHQLLLRAGRSVVRG